MPISLLRKMRHVILAENVMATCALLMPRPSNTPVQEPPPSGDLQPDHTPVKEPPASDVVDTPPAPDKKSAALLH